MKILDLIRNVIVLARVDRPGLLPQVQWFSTRVTPKTPHIQGPGIFFVAPQGAYGFVLTPGGNPDAARFIGGDGARPEEPAPGEGGLHYLGAWKVFLAADGTLHLGAKATDEEPMDFVALSSLVRQALLEIKDAFDNHTHAETGGTTDTPSVPMPDPIEVGSEVVRCL